MNIVSINTGKAVGKDDIQIRQPKQPKDLYMQVSGDKVILSREHYEYIEGMTTFYSDLYRSALRCIGNYTEAINNLAKSNL